MVEFLNEKTATHKQKRDERWCSSWANKTTTKSKREMEQFLSEQKPTTTKQKQNKQIRGERWYSSWTNRKKASRYEILRSLNEQKKSIKVRDVTVPERTGKNKKKHEGKRWYSPWTNRKKGIKVRDVTVPKRTEKKNRRSHLSMGTDRVSKTLSCSHL